MRSSQCIKFKHLIYLMRGPKCRSVHTTVVTGNDDASLRRIRNIGILAHIDAGKTTTTERMLFYSGTINHMGEVHHGNTVTDYLEQERDRGITITSASVTIPWLKHNINIIDTPGHIDFTFEVEQSLNVIDGAIIILDGSAGVEAQTMTVWRQADKYNMPRIIYVNKMDRLDSSLDMCLKSLTNKFHKEFLQLQVPVRGTKTGITSIVDIISKKLYTWKGEQGEIVTITPLPESDELFFKASELRNRLVDRLSVLDDKFADIVLNEESLENVEILSIYDALQRVTLYQKAVPVLCGSSYKNIGVQKLMDAVIDILPSPDMRGDLRKFKHFNNNLCAKAFKVVHDKQKGPVTFFRLYSGSMTKGQKIFNVHKSNTEQVQRLMVALADEYKEVNEVTTGNVAAVTGLKTVFSGDTVTNKDATVKSAVKSLAQETKSPEHECLDRLCPKLQIPDPVFFCSIEAPSQGYQTALDTALDQLQREDPSLQVKTDPDTGQTVLGGMGELHLEIIKDRILKTYKIDADLGSLQIAYKEYLLSSAQDSATIDITLGSAHHNATVEMSCFPREHENQELLVIDKGLENASYTAHLTHRQVHLVENGVKIALQRGPKVGCPVVNACFMLHKLLFKRGTSESIITSTATQCALKMMSSAQTSLMEPIMSLEVITDERNISFVTQDLSRRRADIIDVGTRGENKIVLANVPLSQLLGYSRILRTSTSGNASFTMEFNCYKEISGMDEKEAIKDITGFYPVD